MLLIIETLHGELDSFPVNIDIQNLYLYFLIDFHYFVWIMNKPVG